MADKEQTFTIRQPATANLMIDSLDRDLDNYTFPNQFIISRNQSILNGFFHRIGVSEMVLEWSTGNIGGLFNNDSFTIDISGGESATATIGSGFYTVETLVNALVAKLNTGNAGSPLLTGITWTATAGVQGVGIVPTGGTPGNYYSFSGPLAIILGIDSGAIEFNDGVLVPLDVDLRPYRYLDFTSSSLTYCQDLKDASTASIVRDVLLRWYFAYDQEPQLDGYGYPILMGYTPFTLRRLYNPAKQIRWDPIQPVGQISFEVYDNYGNIAEMSFKTNWLMTLQVSEN